MSEILDNLKVKQAEAAALLLEMEQIVALQALGITRHDIVKQRKITRYSQGQAIPTGEADIIMRDGTKHIIPDHLLRWREEP